MNRSADHKFIFVFRHDADKKCNQGSSVDRNNL